MAEESHRTTSRREAIERVRRAHAFSIDLPMVGRVRIPHPEQVAYYGALAVLAAVEVIDWPIALALAAGHALVANSHNRVVEELGEALEEV